MSIEQMDDQTWPQWTGLNRRPCAWGEWTELQLHCKLQALQRLFVHYQWPCATRLQRLWKLPCNTSTSNVMAAKPLTELFVFACLAVACCVIAGFCTFSSWHTALQDTCMVSYTKVTNVHSM
jgi:hypothetical protein